MALPLFTRRPLPAWALPLVPVIPLAASMGALIRGLRESPALHRGFGLLLALAGGALIVVQTRGIVSIGLGRRRS